MKKLAFLVIPMMALCSGCSLSFIMNHTQGEATDVVDETQNTSPTAKAVANVPINSGSSGQAVTLPPTISK